MGAFCARARVSLHVFSCARVNAVVSVRAPDERREIRLLYKQFREEAPSGKISRKDFNALTSAMGISDQTITKLVFDAFDSNSDEKIEFEEFIHAMSIMTRGSPEEKLKCWNLTFE